MEQAKSIDSVIRCEITDGSLIANNKSEKDIVPCMGLDLGSLHSATADVIINSPTSDRHATQPGSVLQFPIQLFICPQIGSK